MLLSSLSLLLLGACGDASVPIATDTAATDTAAPAEDDADGDGLTIAAGDCDDASAHVHPGALERCDAVDEDCDGDVDEGACGPCTPLPVGDRGFVGCPTISDWSSAHAACVALGGDLASFRSADEQEAVTEGFLAEVGDASYWIGLNDLDREGTFTWTDGSDLGFTAWNAGEPNDSSGNEDCVEVYADVFDDDGHHTWNDHDCAADEFPFVCALDTAAGESASIAGADLGGEWADCCDDVQVAQHEDTLVAWIGEDRGPFSGVFTGPLTIEVYFDPTCCTGQVSPDGDRIDWSNGTNWTR